jgi:hypothetical protein
MALYTQNRALLSFYCYFFWQKTSAFWQGALSHPIFSHLEKEV